MPSVAPTDQVWRLPRAHRLARDVGAVFLLALFVSLMLGVTLATATVLLVGC